MKSWDINRSVEIIKNGGVLAYPTEAVYGLGCSPCFPAAIARIFRLKRRKPAKGLILVGFHIRQFRHLVDLDGLENKSEILASWPGPVTWILPIKPGIPAYLTGQHQGLAVRISAHPVVRLLTQKAGILVSTSANPAGCRPATNSVMVRKYFADRLDFIFPGSAGGASRPSEIRNAATGLVLR